ncbi:MAG: hypothetical protein AAGA30_10240 [Planctomycetota bacterium]
MSAELDPIEELEVEEAMTDATETSTADAETDSNPRGGRLEILKSLSVYDGMLVASAVSISLACLLLVMELSTFDGLFFQWRTGEVEVKALTPP